MRKTISVQLEVELLERLKNAVYWMPGFTVRDIISMGVEYKVSHLEKNNGGPFKQRLANPTAGRKVQ